jgi:hypothetical protein
LVLFFLIHIYIVIFVYYLLVIANRDRDIRGCFFKGIDDVKVREFAEFDTESAISVAVLGSDGIVIIVSSSGEVREFGAIGGDGEVPLNFRFEGVFRDVGRTEPMRCDRGVDGTKDVGVEVVFVAPGGNERSKVFNAFRSDRGTEATVNGLLSHFGGEAIEFEVVNA